ncbi:MAG TPA: efflux RND transporter periplasmic adaptor subunit [Kofleriaceae bacterium]|nr:efflux RND transporter periplasmic adaptor subunit [Kofleriaceae bacterium]
MQPSSELDLDGRPRKRAWLGWAIVALAGGAVLGSFWLRGNDDSSAATTREATVTPVTVAPATQGSITERGHYPGELDADAADIAAFYTGRLVAVHVRVGDTVEKGQVLAELDPVDAKEQIAQARAQAKAAAAEERRVRVERDQAAAEVKRLEPLARDKLIAEIQIDQQRAKAAALGAAVEAAAAGGAEAQARVTLLERRIVESRVRAPFSGRIAERYVDPGAIVPAGSRLVRLVQVAPLRVRFEVPEEDVPAIAPGTSVHVVTKAQPDGEGVLAKVTGIGSEVSRERRVAIAEGLIEDPPRGWLPGMYAEAVVDRRTLPQATIVPSVAVLSRLQPDGRLLTGVLVENGGIAHWVPVRIAARDADRIAIDGDVAPGARVLVGGHIDLMDGSRVRIAGASAESE